MKPIRNKSSATAHLHTCACGQIAVTRDGSGWICERCHRIEALMYRASHRELLGRRERTR